MIPTFLTVAIAGVLGGGLALDVMEIVIIAAVALVLIGIHSGLRMFADLCDLSRD